MITRQHSIPGQRILRFLPTKFPNRRRSIRNSSIYLNLAIFRLHACDVSLGNVEHIRNLRILPCNCRHQFIGALGQEENQNLYQKEAGKTQRMPGEWLILQFLRTKNGINNAGCKCQNPSQNCIFI